MLYIRKKLIHNSNLVVVGFYAYNYYISKINKNVVVKRNILLTTKYISTEIWKVAVSEIPKAHIIKINNGF